MRRKEPIDDCGAWQSVIRASILAVLAIPLTSACGSVRYYVAVDAIAEPGHSEAETFAVVPEGSANGAADVEFRSFASVVRRALESKGLREAPREEADLEIELTYGIGDRREETFTTSVSKPTYSYLGEGEQVFTGQSKSKRMEFKRTGTRTRHSTTTRATYLRHLTLRAFDLRELRRSEERVEVWRTEITSRGSSGDLRRVFPVLVAAGLPYFGEHTDERVNVQLTEGSAAIASLRGASDSADPRSGEEHLEQ